MVEVPAPVCFLVLSPFDCKVCCNRILASVYHEAIHKLWLYYKTSIIPCVCIIAWGVFPITSMASHPTISPPSHSPPHHLTLPHTISPSHPPTHHLTLQSSHLSSHPLTHLILPSSHPPIISPSHLTLSPSHPQSHMRCLHNASLVCIVLWN